MWACCCETEGGGDYEAVSVRSAFGQDGSAEDGKEQYRRRLDLAPVSTGAVLFPVDSDAVAGLIITTQRFARFSPGEVPKRLISSAQQGISSRNMSRSSSFCSAAEIGIPGVGGMQCPAGELFSDRVRKELEDSSTSEAEARLREQVRDLLGVAHEGMCVELVDPDTCLLAQAVLRLDKDLTKVTLRRALCPEQTFPLEHLKVVAKAGSFKTKAPRLVEASARCLLLEFGSGPEFRHCMIFRDSRERDEFNASIGVIRVMARTRKSST